MFRENPVEKMAYNLVHAEKEAQITFAEKDLNQLDQVIKFIEKKLLPLSQKACKGIEEMWIKELHVSPEKVKETILKFANDQDFATLMPDDPFQNMEVSGKIAGVESSVKRTRALARCAQQYAEASKEHDAILSLLDTLKPISANRHAKEVERDRRCVVM